MELPVYVNREVFQPTDNVRINYTTINGDGVYEANLDSIEDYYLFKDNIALYLFRKLVDQKTVTKNTEVINLQEGTIKYIDNKGNQQVFVIPTNIIY